MKDYSAFEKKPIHTFIWMDTPFTAFEFYVDDIRLRVNKKAIWRVTQKDQILFSSANRKTERMIDGIHDLFEELTIRRVEEKPNGDAVVYLNKGVKLELFTQKDGCPCLID